MATTKITDLTAYTDPVNTDVLPIVDVTSDVTKKVSIANVMKNASLGTAAAPGIAFDGDPNTGIYSPGADQVAISTGGSGRLFVDSSGRVLTGTSTHANLNVSGYSGLNTYIANTGDTGISISKFSNDAAGSSIQFIKSRGASVGTNALVSNGDSYGALIFGGADGNGYIRGSASIEALVDATPGAGDMPGRLVFSTTADGASSPTERLRITSAGLVGVGTSSPSASALLDVNGNARIGSAGNFDTDTRLLVASTGGNSFIQIQGADSTGTVGLKLGRNSVANSAGIDWSASTDKLTFRTNGTTAAMTIDSSQRVGIGTTSPSELLELSATTDPKIQFTDVGNTTAKIGIVGSTALGFEMAGSERARIDASGRLLVGTSTARGDFFNTSNRGPSLQVEGTTTNTSGISVTSNQNNDNGPEFNFGKSRGTNTGSSTIVSSGDGLGRISFQGTDGSELVPAAYIEATVDGTPGTNDMPGRLVFSTTADGASSPTERFRLSCLGVPRFFSSDTGIIASVSASAGTSESIFRGRHTATSVSDGTDCVFIRSNGNLQNTNNSYGAISDLKLKENIVNATSQWDDIKALQVRKYNFKEGQTHTQIGLIAQEVEQVSPGLVTESPDRDEEGNDLGTVTKSVNYSVLYMKAVKALQEAMERIEQLEAEVAEVKAQLS